MLNIQVRKEGTETVLGERTVKCPATPNAQPSLPSFTKAEKLKESLKNHIRNSNGLSIWTIEEVDGMDSSPLFLKVMMVIDQTLLPWSNRSVPFIMYKGLYVGSKHTNLRRRRNVTGVNDIQNSIFTKNRSDGSTRSDKLRVTRLYMSDREQLLRLVRDPATKNLQNLYTEIGKLRQISHGSTEIDAIIDADNAGDD